MLQFFLFVGRACGGRWRVPLFGNQRLDDAEQVLNGPIQDEGGGEKIQEDEKEIGHHPHHFSLDALLFSGAGPQAHRRELHLEVLRHRHENR